MANIETPIPLSEIETVLAWVDTFKLSRPTKKINRDFSDAVLLAEILNVHYPKLVEMHNYPPRNSHSLKLNNWMTLNRKVLKKLRLNLCCNTMEQLANCAPGVIERVLVMVRDKIRRDEEMNKSTREAEQNLSSGGSYYEACGDDEHVLVVPIKTRVNGVLETVQQKVISYESYCALKEENKDVKEAADVLKQKVEHLDSLLKLKDERIDELQNQLERKQARRKEAESLTNTLAVPFEPVPPSPKPRSEFIVMPVKTVSLKNIESKSKMEESRIPVPKDSLNTLSRPSLTEVSMADLNDKNALDRIKSDVFKEVEYVDERTEIFQDLEVFEEFKDSEQENITTIEDTIQQEIKEIGKPMEYIQDMSFVN
ncbi:sperm flagellar protein 1-like [Trichoplusia ni]|uniref:Sperm flagellar protein 1-like n=1 Tax=Trichoplusia ni TaxID=7111 RepID=A0A7E5VL09_TRINI|nr:sperm flagellar protein 1-like [Trichoplusia ni]